MSTLASQIESVQPDVFYKLCSEPYFAPVSIVTIREKRLDSEIAAALSGLGALTFPKTILSRKGTKPGATIEILMPTLKSAMEDTAGPICALEQKFLVKEQPTVNLGANGTGLTAEQIAVNLAQTFQLFFMGGPLQGFYAGGTFYRYADAGPGSPFLTMEVTLSATFVLQALTRTVGPQAAAVNNNDGTETVTLTDMQPGGGSVLYYTTDKSFPGPGNSAALIYSAPFNAPTNTVVRTAAYKTGLQGSMIDTFAVT